VADAVTVEPARVYLDVLAWRYEVLEHAGYPVVAAIELAERLDVDLHFAVALLERGASVEQALAIVA
jgi:hypothetical protein